MDAVPRMVSHNVKNLVTSQPLTNGIFLTKSYYSAIIRLSVSLDMTVSCPYGKISLKLIKKYMRITLILVHFVVIFW